MFQNWNDISLNLIIYEADSLYVLKQEDTSICYIYQLTTTYFIIITRY